MDKKRGRVFYPELESLRGLAALSVVIGHSFIMFNYFPSHGFLRGWESWVNTAVHTVFDENSAVILFFVLSGFVLGVQLDGIEGTPLQRLAIFYVRRAFRIVPPLYAAIIAAYVVKRFYGDSQASEEIFRAALLFDPRYLLGPLWSIIIEIGCSLAFPLLYLLRRESWPLINAAVFLVLLSLIRNGHVPEWMRYLIFFQIGLSLDFVWSVMRIAPRLFLLVAAPAYMLPPVVADLVGLQPIVWQTIVGVGAAVILSAVLHGRFFVAVLNRSPLRFLGRISYSAYLFHFIVLYAVMCSIVLPGLVMPPNHPIVYQALAMLITVPATIVVSWLSMRLLEVPSNRLGKSLTNRSAWRPLATPDRREA